MRRSSGSNISELHKCGLFYDSFERWDAAAGKPPPRMTPASNWHHPERRSTAKGQSRQDRDHNQDDRDRRRRCLGTAVGGAGGLQVQTDAAMGATVDIDCDLSIARWAGR